MINEKLDDDVLIQKAFEYFGQGVLFDDFSDVETNQPRRPSDDRVHMMDSIHFGYPRWHVFCRSASFIGLDQDIWLKIDRLIDGICSSHEISSTAIWLRWFRSAESRTTRHS